MTWRLRVPASELAHAATVRCPRCKAEPGEPCTTVDGQPHLRRVEYHPAQLTRTCARDGCGNQFTLIGIGQGSMARRYCGEPDCERQRLAEHSRRKYAAGKGRIPCSICGEPTGWHARQADRTFRAGQPICRPCRSKAHATIDGQTYLTSTRVAVCALPACNNKFLSHTSNTKSGWTIYCSQSCYAKSITKYPNRRDSSKASARKRRAVIATTWDGVTDEQILERDRWTCWICKRRISKKYKWPHMRCATIDHLVPFSRGGDDTEFNKKAAHHDCNLRRHDGHNDDMMMLNFAADGYSWLPSFQDAEVPARKRHCACGAVITTPDKRCGPCQAQRDHERDQRRQERAELGKKVRELREVDYKWQEICDILGISNPGSAFQLAKEAGFVPKEHPERPGRQEVLDAVALPELHDAATLLERPELR